MTQEVEPWCKVRECEVVVTEVRFGARRLWQCCHYGMLLFVGANSVICEVWLLTTMRSGIVSFPLLNVKKKKGSRLP